MTYEDKLTEYFDIIHEKFNAGKMDAAKFGRLVEKIDEWGEMADEAAVE